LVNKSLVVAEASEDGTVHFRMLDLVRQYGRERLKESGEYDTVRQRHTVYFRELAQADEPKLDGSAGVLREAIGRGFSPVECDVYGPHISAARVRLDERPTSIPERPPAGRKPTPLTRREWDVAALVGQGLTNRQISAQLVISEHTVAKHVRKILKTLGLHSRVQIATWVVQQPLLPSNSD
jgi:DNA-binding CsgD family transcriptional regulator